MHQAVQCTIQHTDKTNNKLHARALDDIDTKKQENKHKTEQEQSLRLLSEYIVTEKNDAAFLEYNKSALYNIREIETEDGLPIGIGALDPTFERVFCAKSSRPVDQRTSHRCPIYRQTRVVMTVEKILKEYPTSVFNTVVVSYVIGFMRVVASV